MVETIIFRADILAWIYAIIYLVLHAFAAFIFVTASILKPSSGAIMYALESCLLMVCGLILISAYLAPSLSFEVWQIAIMIALVLYGALKT